MERILALQKMKEGIAVQGNFLNSTQSAHCSADSNYCSSESGAGCSAQSMKCDGPLPGEW